VFTTLLVAVSQAQTSAFPKDPSSVVSISLLPVRRLANVVHQSFLANHLHNILGMVLPIPLSGKQHHVNGNDFPYP
jgi:hypothetical protein